MIAILRLGFWPVQHGPVALDALTDIDVTRGPVYLSPADTREIRIEPR